MDFQKGGIFEANSMDFEISPPAFSFTLIVTFNRQTDRQTEGQTNRQTDRRTEGWTEGDA